MASVVGLFIAVPLILVVPMSFNTSTAVEFPPRGFGLAHYRDFFHNEGWLNSIFNSTVIAAATALISMALVIPAAFAMVRHDFRGKSLVRLLLLLPFIVPSIVMALGYYVYYGYIGLNHTFTGIILAHTAGAIPICFLVVSAVIKGFDQNVERAAVSMGASRVQVFLLVTLPMLKTGFFSAALFSFIFSFDEAVIALFISGRSVLTLPRKMFDSLNNEADPVIAVVSTLLMLLVLLLALGGMLFGRFRNARETRA